MRILVYPLRNWKFDLIRIITLWGCCYKPFQTDVIIDMEFSVIICSISILYLHFKNKFYKI